MNDQLTTKVLKHRVLAGARGSNAAFKSQTLIFLHDNTQTAHVLVIFMLTKFLIQKYKKLVFVLILAIANCFIAVQQGLPIFYKSDALLTANQQYHILIIN